MKYKLFIIFSLLFVSELIYSNSHVYNFNYLNNNQKYTFDNLLLPKNEKINNNYILTQNNMKFEYFIDFKEYKFKKIEENLFRRAEILFFGSLTFATFGGWFFYSVFNAMIYNDPFGTIRREQFLPLYLGSGIISISVVFTDVFINIRPKLKKLEIY